MNKHHEREDLGITTQIATGILMFDPAGDHWEEDVYASVESSVLERFATHQFATNVELKSSSSYYLEFQLIAGVDNKASFNAAVDWLLDYMLNEGCLVTVKGDE